MYTREEASYLRQAFWTTFGQYIAPHLSSEGLKVNWINYKTGVKNVFFRMDADNNRGYIGIELTHTDPEIQQMYFEQFELLKEILHETLAEEWIWKLHTEDEHGKIISRIYKEIEEVSIFNRNHWSDLISFFKPRIISLDQFWEGAKYSFDELK
jgi:hypothetical protein